MDGNGCLFGTLTGNTREVIHKFSVDLPKKHGRGGQSALRFSRLRDEKRHNYVRKVAEQMATLFITTAKPNVAGLILAGSAEFKNDLAKTDLFDQRLKPLILKIVDVSYGDFNGFNQAIELASDVLGNVRFIHEKQILEKFFEDISKEGGKTCYGYIETLKSLEAGAVETLIVFEDLPMTRWKLVDAAGGISFSNFLIYRGTCCLHQRFDRNSLAGKRESRRETYCRRFHGSHRMVHGELYQIRRAIGIRQRSIPGRKSIRQRFWRSRCPSPLRIGCLHPRL
jgi:hypothetical protein